MSASINIPSDVTKARVVGTFGLRQRIATKVGFRYCFMWTIDDFFSHSRTGELQSLPFTASNDDECKWYLNLKFVSDRLKNGIEVDRNNDDSDEDDDDNDDDDNESYEDSSSDESDDTNNDAEEKSIELRLVLDSKSKCKQVSAKFKFAILNKNQFHECNLNSSQTFKFVRKSSESSPGILSVVDKKHLNERSGCYVLKIICEIKIKDCETAPPSVDSPLNDFGLLLKNRLFTDVVLSVGRKKFPAHKLILSARSSVFAAMFTHDMVENRGVVGIKDMAADVVEQMLQYIYTGEVTNLMVFARDLFIAADKYDLKGLRIKCEEALIDGLSSSNVLDVIALGRLYNSAEMRIKATDFFLKNGAEIVNTPAWKNFGHSDGELQLKELCEAFMKSKV